MAAGPGATKHPAAAAAGRCGHRDLADYYTAAQWGLTKANEQQSECMKTKQIDVDALRDRAFRMAQSGLQSARELASAIEQLHDYEGADGWRLAEKPDGTRFKTFREYAAYRNPPGLGFNADDGAADVDAIVSRLIQFDRNRPAIKHLGGSVRGKHGGKREPSGGASTCQTRKPDGKSVAGLADRLQRDFPKVWAEYLAGDHRTVNAAARAAGIVPDRHNPLNEARQAWNRMTKAQRKRFLQMANAAGTGKIEKGYCELDQLAAEYRVLRPSQPAAK